MTNLFTAKKDMLQACEDLYIEYTNNFLSVAGFAEYYELDLRVAQSVIDIGRAINDRRSISSPQMFKGSASEIRF
jgi:hypothetical protein